MIRPLTAIALAAVVLSGCATMRTQPVADQGIVACAPGASSALLSVDALQCWFAAPHGRWRRLSHDSHFDVVVVEAEAADLRDAETITQAFVANLRDTYSEILVYVHRASRGADDRIRRVRWTRSQGVEIFDFTGRP